MTRSAIASSGSWPADDSLDAFIGLAYSTFIYPAQEHTPTYTVAGLPVRRNANRGVCGDNCRKAQQKAELARGLQVSREKYK